MINQQKLNLFKESLTNALENDQHRQAHKLLKKINKIFSKERQGINNSCITKEMRDKDQKALLEMFSYNLVDNAIFYAIRNQDSRFLYKMHHHYLFDYERTMHNYFHHKTDFRSEFFIDALYLFMNNSIWNNKKNSHFSSPNELIQMSKNGNKNDIIELVVSIVKNNESTSEKQYTVLNFFYEYFLAGNINDVIQTTSFLKLVNLISNIENNLSLSRMENAFQTLESRVCFGPCIITEQPLFLHKILEHPKIFLELFKNSHIFAKSQSSDLFSALINKKVELERQKSELSIDSLNYSGIVEQHFNYVFDYIIDTPQTENEHFHLPEQLLSTFPELNIHPNFHEALEDCIKVYKENKKNMNIEFYFSNTGEKDTSPEKTFTKEVTIEYEFDFDNQLLRLSKPVSGIQSGDKKHLKHHFINFKQTPMVEFDDHSEVNELIITIGEKEIHLDYLDFKGEEHLNEFKKGMEHFIAPSHLWASSKIKINE